MNTQKRRNGCFDRPAFAQTQTIGRELVLEDGALVSRPVQIPNFSAADSSCRYTLSDLGQADKGCLGCCWRVE
jgi:hypothetical protein